MIFTLLWLGWFAMFLVIESLALFRYKDLPGKPHTLSAQFWWVIRGRTRWHWIARCAVLAGMVWLTLHFVGWL